MSGKNWAILIAVAILSFLIGFYGSYILKTVVASLVAAAVIIRTVIKFRRKKDMKPLERLNDILLIVLIIGLVLFCISRMTNP